MPKTVTRQRRDCDLNPGPSGPESSTLSTRLPSQPGVVVLRAVRPRAPALYRFGAAGVVVQAATAAGAVDVESVCRTIIGYSGWCVPLRDIQRLRLRGLPSATIRAAMETLERTGLGRCCEVTGNMCVFYKCPPPLVTGAALTRWRLSWNDYSLYFATLPTVNQTNRHNEMYWQRVAISSPYSFT